MSNEQNEKALHDVRRKIAETLNKEDSKLVFGYRSHIEEDHKGGDVWEDISGKKWTIKNGIKQSITKLDTAKTPWFCPKCNTSMDDHRFDVKYWRIRGHCYECHIKEETQLRAEGRWEEVENRRIRLNYLAMLKDQIQELEDYHTNVSSPEFIHADDHNILMIENWNVDLTDVKKDILDEIVRLKDILKSAETEHARLEELIELAKQAESNS